MLIITRDSAIPVLRNVCVAMVTTTVRGIPTEVALGSADGMPTDCAITLDNLRTVPKSLLGQTLTRLSGTRMHEVCEALRRATGC